MTTPIAPANGTMAMRISDRPQRQQPDGRAGKDGREPQSGPQHEAPQQPPAADAPPPLPDESPVPAETLFAASLMADQLGRPQPPAEARAFAAHGWEPPDSPLRLTDKKI